MRFQHYWKDKVVLITGGSSGIGLAAARLLAASGAHLWLTARRADVLEAARQQVDACRLAGASPCGTQVADVSEAAQAAAAVQRVQREAGRLDVVINSAGITLPGYFQDLPLEEFQKQMAVNYFGTLYVIRAALPEMLKRGSGHIINISSMAGYLGVFGYSAYGASKFAVTGLSEVLRAEMKPHGIRISVAFPPDTDTPQLAFETPYKPPETKALSGTAKALPAEVVAGAILEQAARGHFLIFPGFDSRLFYILSTKLPKWLVFAILDQIAASGRKERG
jgi:3-dehydrosphinganine reductase